MVRLLLLIVNLYYCSGSLPDGNPPGDPQLETLPPVDGEAGEPLYLTPYIENGEIEKAQRDALVKLHNFEHIESYSGFLTVDKTYNTNLFFWYFPANQTSPNHTPKSAEVIIYLSCSFLTEINSMHGLFQENGPIRLVNWRFGVFDVYAEEREFSLNKHRHVIYIDHMPGLGFSYTDDWRGYPDSSRRIGELLYTATVQIFTLFPVLQTKYLSILGQLVAAKYAAQLAYLIDENKSTAEIDIKLQRLYLISPWIDPMNQVGHYHKHAYDVGLIDKQMADVARDLQQTVQFHIFNKDWNHALSFFLTLYGELRTFTQLDLLSNLSDGKSYNDFDFGNLLFFKWIHNIKRRKALHVGYLRYQMIDHTGRDALKNDHMQSVQHELSVLARKGYIIFLANGPLSIVVPFRTMYDTMRHFDDRTYVVEEACLINQVNKTYDAFVYMGAIENCHTIAVLQQKVGNFPWLDNPELTWTVVDFFHDIVLPGIDAKDSYDLHSERFQKVNTDRKGNLNHKVRGST